MSPRSDKDRIEKVAVSDLRMNGRSLKRIRRWQRRIWRVSDEGLRIRQQEPSLERRGIVRRAGVKQGAAGQAEEWWLAEGHDLYERDAS